MRRAWRWSSSGTTSPPACRGATTSSSAIHALRGEPRPDIGRAFIAAAADALRDGGELWLVANRQLPYEQALAGGFPQVREVAAGGGFKVIHAVRGR